MEYEVNLSPHSNWSFHFIFIATITKTAFLQKTVRYLSVHTTAYNVQKQNTYCRYGLRVDCSTCHRLRSQLGWRTHALMVNALSSSNAWCEIQQLTGCIHVWSFSLYCIIYLCFRSPRLFSFSLQRWNAVQNSSRKIYTIDKGYENLYTIFIYTF